MTFSNTRQNQPRQKPRPTVQPLHDFVLLERLANERPKSTLLEIPDSAMQPSQKFKVVAVGPGRVVDGHRVPMEVEVGDTVLLGNYSFVEVQYGGRTVHMVSAADVLAVVS